MSDDLNQGVVIPGETTPPANTGGTIERTTTETAGGDNDDVQSRARAMGWVPKDQFRGPAENWRDADEFVRRGEEELPILRERLRSTTREIENMKRDFDSRITMLTKTSAVALQRQREELEAAYDNAMRQATASGDVERFDQLNRDKRQAIYNHDQRVRDAIEGDTQQQRQQQYQAPQQNGQQRPLPPEVSEWIDRNPWFNRDPELQSVAAGYSRKLEIERPHLTLQENLAATERYIKEQRYADRFGGAQRGAQVEGGSRVSSGDSRRMGASRLPPEAKAAAERFIKQGLYKSMDDYAKVYFEQEGA